MRTIALLVAGLALLTGAAKDPAYEAWRAELKATSISLVYAAQFGGNPASYMGHLFLKVRSTGRGPARNRTIDLMDKTFGFVALVPEGTGAAAYAWKGLMGGFDGGFIANDFFQLSFEYQSLESRDLWEYEVALSEAERERFLKLLWDLMHAGPFTYRFFDGNCAWMLGDMLWKVRPDILAPPGRPGLFTTPHDVIEWLAKHRLIASTRVWPSERAQYLARVGRLSESDQEQVDRDYRGHAVAESQSYLYYDALVARHDYEEAKAKKAPPAPAAAAKEMALSRLAKAELPATGQPVVRPETTDPAAAHPLTLGLLALGRQGSSGFADAEIRPAGHDLLDPPAGFSDDMGLAFVSGRVRYDGEAKRLRLRYFDLMRMKSLAPFTRLDRAPAWTFRAGAYDWSDPNFHRGYAGASGGLGLSTGLFTGAKAWILGGAGGRYALSEKRGDVGPTLEVGALAHFGEGLRLLALSEALLPFVVKGRRGELEVVHTFGIAATVAPATDVRFEARLRRQARAEAALALGHFF